MSKIILINFAIPNKVIQAVTKNMKHLDKYKGQHERWSLKDVPIKLTRKPTNFSFLYNSRVMSDYYNHKMVKQELSVSQTRNNDLNTSYDNFKDFKQKLLMDDRRTGGTHGDSTPDFINRSINVHNNNSPKLLRSSTNTLIVRPPKKSESLRIIFRSEDTWGEET